MATGQCYLRRQTVICLPTHIIPLYSVLHIFVHEVLHYKEKATKERTLVAIVLCAKELTENLYQ